MLLYGTIFFYFLQEELKHTIMKKHNTIPLINNLKSHLYTYIKLT